METKVGSSRKKEIAEGVKNNHGFEHWFSPRKSHKQTKSNTKTRSEDFRDDPCICWRVEYSPLGVPWTARRSDQSILKEINPKYSLEDWCWSWSSNPLATWCKELTHWKRPWCWERLKGNEKRATEDEMLRYHHQLNGHEPEKTAGDSDGQGNLACCSPWGCKVRSDSATEQQ